MIVKMGVFALFWAYLCCLCLPQNQLLRKMKLIKLSLIAITLMVQLPSAWAQRTLTLDECRDLALQSSHELEQAATKMDMAKYDKRIAFANYFPNISATGTYMHNSRNISLVSDEMSAALTSMGTTVQGQINNTMQELTQAIMSNPKAAAEYLMSPLWQTVLGSLSKTDVSEVLNAIGTQIDDALHLDTKDMFAGAVSLQQPIFVGGKIINANKIAALAQELAQVQYNGTRSDVLLGVEQAYWQVVSVAAKKSLAESYAELLHSMEHNVQLSADEGLATASDLLAVKVKANEADMLLTKSSNGLALSKMLLCKLIGLDLQTDIVLADEGTDKLSQPVFDADKDTKDVIADRPETRSLSLGADIYDKKVAIARADMMPKIALTANYLVSNPSVYNGFQKEWGGMFNAGVVVNVPIFHGFEALQKTRKAKAEATLYRSRYSDACELITLQLSQLRLRRNEAFERMVMAESHIDSAEENLRKATLGFSEGVVDSNTALAAQTAWLQAHSEYIDAGIELQMTAAELRKAEAR